MRERNQHRGSGLAWVLLLAISIALPAPSIAHEIHHEDDSDVDIGKNDQHQPSHVDPFADLSRVELLVIAFQETGDDSHLDEAWSLVEPVLAQSPNQPSVLIEAAFVAQARHDFSTALQLAHRAIHIDRRNDQAWLLLASIHLVQGNARAADRACDELRRTPLLVLMTCKARAIQSDANSATAYRHLTRILSTVETERLRPDWYAWSLSVVGDLAVAAGLNDEAINHFRESLQTAERTQVRTALVDVLLEQDRVSEARDALRGGSTALPLEVRRMIVARRLGQHQEITASVERAHREFQRWIAAEDWLHAREMSQFYLDVMPCPKLARRLAVINLSVQREPEDILLERRTRS